MLFLRIFVVWRLQTERDGLPLSFVSHTITMTAITAAAALFHLETAAENAIKKNYKKKNWDNWLLGYFFFLYFVVNNCHGVFVSLSINLYLCISFAARCETHATSSTCSMSNSLFGFGFGHIGRWSGPRSGSFADGLRELFTYDHDDDNHTQAMVPGPGQAKPSFGPTRERESEKKREKYPWLGQSCLQNCCTENNLNTKLEMFFFL